METQNSQPSNLTIRERMKADLTAAMKARQMQTASTLRTVLGTIDNAEAVPVTTPVAYTNGKTNDVPRKHLTAADIEQILRQELQSRAAMVQKYQDLGREEDAVRLQAEVTLIAGYLYQLSSEKP